MGPQHQRRVLAVVKGLGPGGAEQLLVTTAKAIDRDAFALEVAYVLPWKRHLVGKLEDLGVATHCVGGAGGMRDPRWVLRLWRLLGRYDVVHLHSPVVAAAARVLVRLLPARRRPAVVSTEHNSWSSHNRYTRWANRLTFRLGDAWIAVSDEVRSSMPAALRDRTERIVHGIDLSDFDEGVAEADRAAVRQELGVDPGTVVVLTVANLRRTKGYPDLLVAARKVLDSGVDVRFFAVGQGPLEEELQAQARALDLGDGFVFLGFRRDAPRLLAGADLMAMASLHEGFPIAVMEAMAAGLPVVATTVGGIPEAVEAGKHGILVPPQRPDLLADAILDMARDPQRRVTMAHSARASAGRYDFRRAMRRMEDIYRSVAPVR